MQIKNKMQQEPVYKEQINLKKSISHQATFS